MQGGEQQPGLTIMQPAIGQSVNKLHEADLNGSFVVEKRKLEGSDGGHDSRSGFADDLLKALGVRHVVPEPEMKVAVFVVGHGR
jgi:hypothetical protein